jgi:hypothetical protein
MTYSNPDHQHTVEQTAVCAMTNDTWQLVRYRHHPESPWHYGLVCHEACNDGEPVDVDTVDPATAQFILANFLGITVEDV